MQQLLSILQIPPQVSPVPSGISQDDFISHWRCCHECTSSSYSGLYYGHYKASVDCPCKAKFHALITEMTFKHGYSLSCWQSSLQVFLKENPGSIHVADLHALGLLEANFNTSIKILVGHHMVWQALQANLIPSECYGSVPSYCTIQVSFSCCLLADVSCQCHQSLALACEDFAHCKSPITQPFYYALAWYQRSCLLDSSPSSLWSFSFVQLTVTLQPSMVGSLPTPLPRCLSR